jgi:hypothetical protein
MAQIARTSSLGSTVDSPEQIHDLVDGAEITEEAISAQAEVAAPLDDDHFLIRKAAGAALRKVKFSGFRGDVLQIVPGTYFSTTAISATIPFDNTEPDASEGTLVWQQTITPKKSTSGIYLDAGCIVSAAGSIFSAATTAIFAVFRGTTCIAVRVVTISLGAAATVRFLVSDAPTSTAELTYSVRAGKISGTTNFSVNQISSGTYFAGKLFEGSGNLLLEVAG